MATAIRRHGCNQCRIDVTVVDDATMAALNAKHLGHRRATDVLTFDLSDEGRRNGLEGAIVVSGETARREAVKRRHSLTAELALYAVHGVLHLLGHDDADRAAAARMHDLEDEILRAAGIGPVYDHRNSSERGQAK